MPRKRNPHSTPYVKPDYHSQNKCKSKHNAEGLKSESEKKVKLRSSLDIYHRLLHDESLHLDLSKVYIGYTDHVLGDQEQPILEWQLIEKGGDIPMHHILYFVYKAESTNNSNKILLWDRNLKLDRLYSSGRTNKPTESLDAVRQFLHNYRQQLIHASVSQSVASMKHSKPTIAFDIDGTIADIEDRLQLVPASATKQQRYKSVLRGVQNGEAYFQYDRVIPVALAYLKYIESTRKFNIIYLSGRPESRVHDTMKWLFEFHGFPKAMVIHKPKREHIEKYKQRELSKWREKLNIVAYFGDTMIDVVAAIHAHIRPVLVLHNEWLFAKHIQDGIDAVMKELEDMKPAHLETVKRSAFWGLSYQDLIPMEFATEVFDDGKQESLPYRVQLKCRNDSIYWNEIMKESEQLRLQRMDNEETKEEQEEEKEKKVDNEIAREIQVEDEMMTKWFPRYPCTDDGFVQSFQINDTRKWLHYLHYYGFVVLKVLNEEEADRTVDAMFDELYQRTMELQEYKNRTIYKVDMNNPFTWNSFNFPKPFGKFLTDRPAFCKQAFVNRCSKKMHYIWSSIFENEKLNVSIENWGIQRGTKDLKFREPETNEIIQTVQDEPKWRRNLRPHWDVNPWTYSENTASGEWVSLYQGAVALTDQRLIDGTHLNLPGCTRFLNKWCEQNKQENSNRFKHNINFNDALIKYMQPIPLRKGEMIIWNFGQLHANTKNGSDRMRLTQYIRMLPAEAKYVERDRRSAPQQIRQYKDEIDVKQIVAECDDRTSKLLGFTAWYKTETE